MTVAKAQYNYDLVAFARVDMNQDKTIRASGINAAIQMTAVGTNAKCASPRHGSAYSENRPESAALSGPRLTQ